MLLIGRADPFTTRQNGADAIAISTQPAYLAKLVLRHFDGAEHGCVQTPEAFFRRDERGVLAGVAW